MTDQEILELPKAWVVGGDGGMGDIGSVNGEAPPSRAWECAA